MNDAWDPMDELEPLDDTSLGLLASFRDAQGPSEDSQARMLAGIRARIAAESSADDPAAAVAPRPAPEVSQAAPAASAGGNVRTLVVATLAFAAGVALTLSLASSDASGPSNDSDLGRGDHVASRDSAGQPVRPADRPSSVGPSPSGFAVPVQAPPQTPELAWPLSIADLSAPKRVGETPDEETPSVRSVEPTPSDPDDGGSESRRRSGVISPDDDPIADAEPSRRRGTGPTGTDPASRGSATGAWTPSLTPPSAAGAGIGAAARNPAVGGAPPSPASGGNNSQSGSSQSGSPGEPDTRDGGSEDAPSQNDEPESSGEEPDSEPDPDEEPEEEPEEDELSEEELCEAELDACLADAEQYCEYGFEGCPFVHDFCLVRAETCLGGPPPFDPPPPPDEPEPYDCFNDYEMCIMETDSMCMFGKVPPDECDTMYWACEDILAACEGQPPPSPPPW